MNQYLIPNVTFTPTVLGHDMHSLLNHCILKRDIAQRVLYVCGSTKHRCENLCGKNCEMVLWLWFIARIMSSQIVRKDILWLQNIVQSKTSRNYFLYTLMH